MCDHSNGLDQPDEDEVWYCKTCGAGFVAVTELDKAAFAASVAVDVAADLLWRFHERARQEGRDGIAVPGLADSGSDADDAESEQVAARQRCEARGYHDFDGKTKKAPSLDACRICGHPSPFIGG